MVAFTISCNESEVEESSLISCSDGVMNGDEIGIDCGGSCENDCLPENAIEGELVSVLQLTSDKEYVLTGPLLVRDGGRLLVQAGTVVKAQKGNDVYIAIAQGGEILVYGREDAPVIITSAEDNPQPGDWGGLLICGKAPLNSGEISRSRLLDLFYGGNDTTDSSGLLRYLRIEYAGALQNDGVPFNAFSFYGVGASTTISNVQSYNSLGNGFEFVGGSVNVENLVANNSNANGIYLREGWDGVLNRCYLEENEEAGIAIANNEQNSLALPLTQGEIFEVTIIGPNTKGISLLNGGGAFSLSNIYTKGLNIGINVSGSETVNLIDSGNFTINNIEFDDPFTDFIVTNYTGTFPSFYNENSNAGAGNKELTPEWAINWIR